MHNIIIKHKQSIQFDDYDIKEAHWSCPQNHNNNCCLCFRHENCSAMQEIELDEPDEEGLRYFNPYLIFNNSEGTEPINFCRIRHKRPMYATDKTKAYLCPRCNRIIEPGDPLFNNTGKLKDYV